METTTNIENNDDINLVRPELVRQLTSHKWSMAKNIYENGIDISNKDNYVNENGIDFLLVGMYNSDKHFVIRITKHYLIKINENFFEVVFNFEYEQPDPEIKNISHDEYILFQENEIKENYIVIQNKKIKILNHMNFNEYYFIITYKYKENETCPKCHIKLNF